MTNVLKKINFCNLVFLYRTFRMNVMTSLEVELTIVVVCSS